QGWRGERRVGLRSVVSEGGAHLCPVFRHLRRIFLLRPGCQFIYFHIFSVQQESAAFPPPLLFCVQKPILPFVRLYAYFQGYSPGYAVLFPDIFSAKDAVFLEDICQITVLLLSRAACPYQFQQYLPEPPSL